MQADPSFIIGFIAVAMALGFWFGSSLNVKNKQSRKKQPDKETH